MKHAVVWIFTVALAGCGLFDTGPGNGNGNNMPGTATSLEGVWRGASAQVQYFDGTVFKDNTRPIVFPFDEGLLDRGSLDQYIQIAGTTLTTYTFFANDAFYTKLTHALSCSSRECTQTTDGVLAATGVTSAFKIDDGHFTQSITYPIVTPMQGTIAIETVRYESYGGTLPPSSWPAKALELN